MKTPNALTPAVVLLAALAGCCCSAPSHQTPTPSPADSSDAANIHPGAESGHAVHDIVVDQALFGSGSHLADVTARVVQLLQSDPDGFTAHADSMGIDPLPGKTKSLLIRYHFRGEERFFMVTGGNLASYHALIDVVHTK